MQEGFLPDASEWHMFRLIRPQTYFPKNRGKKKKKAKARKRMSLTLKLFHHQVRLHEVNCWDAFTPCKKYYYYNTVCHSINKQYYMELIYHLPIKVALT